ncbi:MAG TPA: HAD family hydrolase [Candidatus Binatia bacterium]|nr:HAD family hydrolase [Candidatus Binatia bacterium]
MEPVRCVLFDAGNTLMHLDYDFIAGVVTEHGHAVAPMALRLAEYHAKAAIDRELAPEMAAPDSIEGLIWLDGDQRPSYFATVLHHVGVPRERVRPMLDALQAHNRADSLWRIVDSDTPAVLRSLSDRGFTLAVISNSDGRVEGDLARYGLRSHFATVIDSHLVGVEKPNPAIFHLALEQLGYAASQSVYIGDVFGIDVKGARRAGLQAVLIDTLGRYHGRVDCPRVSRLRELLDLLPATAAPA